MVWLSYFVLLFSGLYVSKKLSFSSRFIVFSFITVVHSNSVSVSMYFCRLSCDFSSLISYFVYLGLFFMVSLVRGLSIFVCHVKESALGFIDFFFFGIVFKSVLFISSLIFIISFHLLTLGLWFDGFFLYYSCILFFLVFVNLLTLLICACLGFQNTLNPFVYLLALDWW